MTDYKIDFDKISNKIQFGFSPIGAWKTALQLMNDKAVWTAEQKKRKEQ